MILLGYDVLYKHLGEILAVVQENIIIGRHFTDHLFTCAMNLLVRERRPTL